MKKIVLFIFLAMFIFSCSIEDDQNVYYNTVLVPIEDVELPDTLVFQEIYNFEVTYERASTCHSFAGYDYEKDGNERTVALVNAVYYNAANCESLEDELQTADLPFEVLREDFYTFKFWQGTDENGENIYLVKEVPVKIE